MVEKRVVDNVRSILLKESDELQKIYDEVQKLSALLQYHEQDNLVAYYTQEIAREDRIVSNIQRKLNVWIKRLEKEGEKEIKEKLEAINNNLNQILALDGELHQLIKAEDWDGVKRKIREALGDFKSHGVLGLNSILEKLESITAVEKIIPGINIKKLHTIDNPMMTKRSYHSDKIELLSDEPRMSIVYNELSKKKQNFDELKNQVLVDLGAGSFGQAYLTFAQEYGCKAYIAVEPIFYEKLHMRLSQKPGISKAVIAEDMLTFLKRLPNNSVSFIISGVEYLPRPKYINAVKEEIKRTLHKKGVCLIFESQIKTIEGLKRELIFERHDDYFYKYTHE